MYKIYNMADVFFGEFHQPPEIQTLGTTPTQVAPSNSDSFLWKRAQRVEKWLHEAISYSFVKKGELKKSYDNLSLGRMRANAMAHTQQKLKSTFLDGLTIKFVG